jgi:hypothetical protein
MSALAGSAAGNLRPGGRFAPKCLRKYFFKMNCLYLSPALETKGLHSLGRLLQSTHDKPDLLTGGALGAVAWEIITREGQERFLDALNVFDLSQHESRRASSTRRSSRPATKAIKLLQASS